MLFAYNPRALKKATNLSIIADLLRQAKGMDINLSATLERVLVEVLKQGQRDRWITENHAAMAAYNDHVEKHGVFSDGLRSF